MGNGTKIGLVLVLILGVVVIATVLDRDLEGTPDARQQASVVPTGDPIDPKVGSGIPANPGRSFDGRQEPNLTTPSDGGYEDRGFRGDLERDEPLYDPMAESTQDPMRPVEPFDRVPGDGFPDDDNIVPAVHGIPVTPGEDGIDGRGGVEKLTPKPDPEPPAAVPPPTVPKNEPAKTAPATGYPKTHVVEEGESMWNIAKAYYGKGTLYTLIEKANPSVEAETMGAGTKLTIPDPKDKAAPKTSTDSTQPAKVEKKVGYVTYEIEDEDTLYDIAVAELGDGSRWEEIKKANPGLDELKLVVGKKIYLPEK